jgi:hypothetical protein
LAAINALVASFAAETRGRLFQDPAAVDLIGFQMLSQTGPFMGSLNSALPA